MDLSENKLTGTIPPEVGNLIHLGSLFLENNKLNGTIATEMFRLPFLRVIDIGVNDFTGAIPTYIGICASLIDFNVASNRLNGSIPHEILLLTNLEVLMLSENELTGMLPLEIYERDVYDDNGDLLVDDDGEPLEFLFSWSNLTQLVALAMDRNNLVGTFPSELLWGLRSSLTSLDIGYNFFTGTLPDEIGDMQKLKRFSAPFNFLTGFGKARQVLYFSRAAPNTSHVVYPLYYAVPSELERMKDLQKLNLTSNM
jgi:LRR receptor-like serine/threonine-protein kinase FLS2